MGHDSDTLNTALKPLLEAAKAAASKRDGTFDPPAEDENVQRRRAANDAHGQRINPLRRGK